MGEPELDTRPCPPHDFMPGVVVRAEDKSLFGWGFVWSSTVMESVVYACRRCGKTLTQGWQPTDAE